MAAKILLYEDNKELRDSLTLFLGMSADFELMASFENCSQVANHLHTYDPDIVLMDIEMPVMGGIQGLKIIRSIDEDLPVLMLTVFEDRDNVLTSIREGATGYLLKQHISDRLISAMSEALDGGAPMSPIVARMVLRQLSDQCRKTLRYELTFREKEILQSLTDGNSVKMIAANLGIQHSTVCTHIKNIYEKLGVHSQAEAVSKTLRERLI